MMRMPRLVGICKDEDNPKELKKRQLPVYIDDMRTMIAEFEDPCCLTDFLNVQTSVSSPSMSLKLFSRKLDLMRDSKELIRSLSVDYDQFSTFLSQIIPCVGCRRCVEKLYFDLARMGYPSVEPFVITDVSDTAVLSVSHQLLTDHKRLHRYLVGNYAKCRAVIDNLTKCRKNKRCSLHTLENHVCKSGTCFSWSWEEMWDLMSTDCREECCIVEADSLLEMLESYLQKHRFCPECKNKLMRAYHCLVGQVDKTKEKGYNPKLFEGLKYCSNESHLHITKSVDYLDSLVERAEVELGGSSRERHAKTLEVGQIEVLTCLGLYLHGRLHRMTTALRTLQASFLLLYCSATMALFANFQAYVEQKQGLNESFERLCAELQDSAANPSKMNNKTKKKKKIKAENKTNLPLKSSQTSSNTDNDSVCSEPTDLIHTCKRRETTIRKVSRSQSPSRSGRQNQSLPSKQLEWSGSSDAGYASREGSPVSSPQNDEAQCKGFTEGCTSCTGHARKSKDWNLVSSPCCENSAAADMSLTNILEDNVTDGAVNSPVPISEAAIAWFQANQSEVSEKREALRRRMWERFEQMQTRLANTAK